MTTSVTPKNRLLLKALNRLLRELDEDLAVIDRWPDDPLATGIGLASNPDQLAHFAIENWESRPKNMIRDVRFCLWLKSGPKGAEKASVEESMEGNADHSDLTFADLMGHIIQHMRRGRSTTQEDAQDA